MNADQQPCQCPACKVWVAWWGREHRCKDALDMSREPRWSNGEMDEIPQSVREAIDVAFGSDDQRYGTMPGVRRSAFAAGYRAALAHPTVTTQTPQEEK